MRFGVAFLLHFLDLLAWGVMGKFPISPPVVIFWDFPLAMGRAPSCDPAQDLLVGELTPVLVFFREQGGVHSTVPLVTTCNT